MSTNIENTGANAPTVKEAIAAKLKEARQGIDTLPGIPEGSTVTHAAMVVKATVAAKEEQVESPIVPLGRRGDNEIIFHVPATGETVRLTPTAMRSDNLLLYVSIEDYARWLYPECVEQDPTWGLKNKQLVMCRAKERLLEMAQKCGLYNPERLRKIGVWREAVDGVEGYLYNAGHACFFAPDGGEELRTVSSNQERHLYSREVASPAPRKEMLSPGEVETLADFLDARSWEEPRHVCGKILVGWIANSILAGAVKRRPHIWVTGPAGIGKTFLYNDLLTILGFSEGEGNGFGVVLEGATSTAAGARQKINSRAVPVIFDELENNIAYRVNKNIEGIINLMRTSYSSPTGIFSMGGEDGNARDYMVRCGFLCFSVHSKLDRDTDYSRCIELRLVQMPDAKMREIWKKQEVGRKMIGKEGFTGRLIYTVMRRAQVMQKFEGELENFLRDVTRDARRAELFAHLLAGYFALIRDNGELDIVDLAKAKECVNAYALMEDVNTEFEECLETLLSHTECVAKQQRSVRQLCRLAGDVESAVRKDAADQLDTLGLEWQMHKKQKCLRVRIYEKTLNTKVFGSTRWDGKLRRVLGAGCGEDGKPNEHGVMLSSARRGKKIVKVLYIPQELILPREAEEEEG